MVTPRRVLTLTRTRALTLTRRSPPAEYDHAQLSGLCDALLAAALQHCRQRASLYVRLVEHSLPTGPNPDPNPNPPCPYP